MALQFVIGRSGSGKSTALYQTIIEESLHHPKTNYLLIVPDQFTLDTQKMLIGMHPNHGTGNIDILSFHRLAYKIFAELSQEPGVILEDLGKSMILQKILGKRKKELPLFRANRDKMGFIDELKSLFSEFYQYNVTVSSLEQQLEREKEGTLLHEKLSELLLVMREFEAFMGQDYIVAEQLLTVLGRRAGESKILADSVILLDGFTGFTPVQNDLLARLMPICRDMYVTVTMDEREAGFTQILDYELFSVSKETIFRLRRIADEQQVPVLPDWIIAGGDKGRFQPGSELDFLERHLFRPHRDTCSEPTRMLEVRRLSDPEEEALYAARTISRLVREEGLRYREIGVISGDLNRYGGRLSRILEEYGIPYFLDDTTGMRSHPLVECIRGVFSIFEFDFSYESVCHYVKNGMTAIAPEDGDALDHYLLAAGLRGYGVFAGKFRRKPRRMGEKICVQAEKAREQLFDEIRELAPVFRRKKARVLDYLNALYDYMVKMDYEHKMEEEAARFEMEGNYVFASAYSQVYGQLIQLLDKIAAILGEEELELTELRRIMDAGLEELKLGTIPPGPDQVLIGDMERTRLGQLKVLLFLGVNEGVIPKPEKGGGILSDGDREALEGGALSLAPDARKNTGLEQFYLYLNLTKPSQKLYLTMSAVDQEGQSLRPSYLIGRLKLMYPALTCGEGLTEQRSYDQMKSSLPYLRECMDAWFAGEADQEQEAFLRWMFQTEEGKRWVEDGLRGRFYTNEEKGLSREAARAVYGLHMEASVTRLESYAGCAFAHFLKYGLMLSERQKYQIRSADLGQILHRCLELFSKEVKERKQKFRSLEDEQRDELAVECLRRAVEEYDPVIFHSSARNEACIERMERLVKRTIWALHQQLKKSDFEPAEFEWRFQSGKELNAVRLPLQEGGTLQLQGIVDRIDYYETEDDLYVKITDYKSGMQTFQLADVYHGLSLQLVVYMNAVLEKIGKEQQKKVTPAGIFYFHIQDPLVEQKEGGSMEEELLSQFDLSGLALGEKEVVEHLDFGEVKSVPVSYKKDGTFTASSSVATREQLEALGKYVKEKIVSYGNEIQKGNISIAPYREEKKTACDYCEYRGVCGFDPAFAGNRYRMVRKADKKRIWEDIEEGR